jgi:hypothetical protein
MKLIGLIFLLLGLFTKSEVLINKKFVQDTVIKDTQYHSERPGQYDEGIGSDSVNIVMYYLRDSLLFTKSANALIYELNRNKELTLRGEFLKIVNTYFIVPLIHSP